MKALVWRWLIIVVTAFWLLVFCVGKAFAETSVVEEVVTSPTTFAVCKTADVLSTIYVIEHSIGVEANPVIAPLLTNGYIPFIALSVGIWWLIKEYNNPTVTAAANVVGCGVAAHNLLLIP